MPNLGYLLKLVDDCSNTDQANCKISSGTLQLFSLQSWTRLTKIKSWDIFVSTH